MYRYSAVEVLNFFKNGAEMTPQYKLEAAASGKSCQVKQFTKKKTKMLGQNNPLFMGNILPTLELADF